MRERLNPGHSGCQILKAPIAAVVSAIAALLILALPVAASRPAHAATSSTAVTSSWPADSLHRVDVSLETAQGSRTSFAATAGKVRIVTMFYASCTAACPLNIDTLRRIDGELSAAERARLAILLVTLDPQHDDPATLREFAAQHRIEDGRWTLGRASLPDTRKLAGALDVRYRQLEDGNFNHSTVLVLLDPAGRILGRSDKMGTPDPDFVALVRKALSGA
jgi:protein SCO1